MAGVKRKRLDDILRQPPPMTGRALVPAARESQGRGGRPMGGSKLQALLAKPISFLDVPPNRDDVAQFKLAEKDWEFVRQYLLCGMNASEAARRVKPNLAEKSAGSTGMRWLRNKKVKAAIQHLNDLRAADIEFQAQDVFRELMGFTLANVFDYFKVTEEGHLILKDTDSLTDQQKRNVKKLRVTTVTRTEGRGADQKDITTQTIEAEVYDRQENTRDIARILGLFKERVDLDIGPNLAAILRQRAQQRGITVDQ